MLTHAQMRRRTHATSAGGGGGGSGTPGVGSFLQVRRGDDGRVREASSSVANAKPSNLLSSPRDDPDALTAAPPGPRVAAEMRRDCAEGDER